MKISIKFQWNKLCVPLWASTAHWMCDGVNKHLYKCVLNREAVCVCVCFLYKWRQHIFTSRRSARRAFCLRPARLLSFSFSFLFHLQILLFFVPSFLPLSFIEHDFSCIKMPLSASRLWWYLKNWTFRFYFLSFFKLCFQIALVSLSFQRGFSYFSFSFHWYFSLFKSHVTGCISQNMFSSEDV